MPNAALVAAVIALAGCGGGGGRAIDAGGSGSGGDDGPPIGSDGPPASTKVRVRFWNQNMAFPGATVLFQSSTGAVLATATTDDAGNAQADLPGIASVSVLVDDTDGAHDVFTWLGVRSGDVLALGNVPIEETSIASIVLTVPSPGGTPTTITARCGSEQTSARTLGNYHPCGSPTSWLLESGNTAWYSAQYTLQNGQQVDLSAANYLGLTSVTVGAMHVPPDPGSAVQRVTCSAAIADLAFVLSSEQFGDLTESGSAASMAFPIKDLQTAAPITAACTKYVAGAGSTTLANRQVPQSGPVTFDFAQPHVPTALGSVAYTSGTLGWTETGSGGDFVFSAVSLRGPTSTLAKPRVRIYVTGPKAGTALTMPVFPAPYAASNPAADDTATVDRLVVGTATGGYDAARAHVHRAELNDPGSIDWLAGTLSLIER